MENKDREERIKAEQRRLKRFYKSLSGEKKGLAAGLIERAAFMRISCEDLEEDLRENGWTELFSQGNQEPYQRARPQGTMYNALAKNYRETIKQLDALLPKEERKAQESDGFDVFVRGRETT